MHHWWCKCRNSPGFTPSCRQGEGKGAVSDPAAHFSCCLQSEMCSQNSSTEYAARSQPEARLSWSNPYSHSCLLGDGRGSPATQLCSVDHSHPHPEVASAESFTLPVPAAGSLIKATVLLIVFPLLACPFLQSWFFVQRFFITAWGADPGLSPTPGTGPQALLEIRIISSIGLGEAFMLVPTNEPVATWCCPHTWNVVTTQLQGGAGFVVRCQEWGKV